MHHRTVFASGCARVAFILRRHQFQNVHDRTARRAFFALLKQIADARGHDERAPTCVGSALAFLAFMAWLIYPAGAQDVYPSRVIHLVVTTAAGGADDFVPISIISRLPTVMMARADLPANNVEQLIALAYAHPGKLDYASTGVGTSLHVGNHATICQAWEIHRRLHVRETAPGFGRLLAEVPEPPAG